MSDKINSNGIAEFYIDKMAAQLEELRAERDQLKAVNEKLVKSLKGLDSAISNIRKDIGTQYPALAEAWALANMTLAEANELREKGKV